MTSLQGCLYFQAEVAAITLRLTGGVYPALDAGEFHVKGALFVLSLVGQLGYMIAIPAVIGAAGGAYLDKYYGSSPLWILVGLVLAIGSSSYWIWTLIKQINESNL